jgi:hypothetical protein
MVLHVAETLVPSSSVDASRLLRCRRFRQYHLRRRPFHRRLRARRSRLQTKCESESEASTQIAAAFSVAARAADSVPVSTVSAASHPATHCHRYSNARCTARCRCSRRRPLVHRRPRRHCLQPIRRRRRHPRRPSVTLRHQHVADRKTNQTRLAEDRAPAAEARLRRRSRPAIRRRPPPPVSTLARRRRSST